MKVVRIPQRVDEPPHVLLWSVDELAPMMIGLTFGIFIGQALFCFLAGLFITRLYRRFRDSRPDGYLLHLLFRAGFLPCRARSFKNPYVRRFIE